jgi:Type II secretion system (T2SS), protein M subtype b
MHLEPGDRRTLGVGALVVTVILLLGRGVPLARAWESSQISRAELEERRLHGARELLDSVRPHRTAGNAGAPFVDADLKGIFHGPSPDEAAAGLARLVDQTASIAGVQISSNALQADSVFAETFSLISSRVVAITDVQGLVDWLDRLERLPQLVRVREFSVTQPDPAADEGTPEALRIELVVEGLAAISESRSERKR